MNDEELAVFFETARECFKFANDGFVLNKDKYVSLGYSEEAAEMFYMIKHNCVFKDMPFEYSEGKNLSERAVNNKLAVTVVHNMHTDSLVCKLRNIDIVQLR